MFEEIISLENLVEAWREFLNGKRGKSDVQLFSLNLMNHIFSLHRELVNQTYRHSNYVAFNISDPKPRNIHKARVRDRLLHHAIYRVLYPHFDKTFIADSFSCRNQKGTHKALGRFRRFIYTVSKNHTKQCWILKCDIQKFFASIDHFILLSILEKRVDRKTLWLCGVVIKSFYTNLGKGLPLGNLTSQLFANVYMNEFDLFVKHNLKERHYIRYADDFVIISSNKRYLLSLVPHIDIFLKENLNLHLHRNKIFVETIGSGVDFLGWIHFPKYRVLRTATKKRMLQCVREHPTQETLSSYIGLLRHGNTRKLKNELYKTYMLSKEDYLN